MGRLRPWTVPGGQPGGTTDARSRIRRTAWRHRSDIPTDRPAEPVGTAGTAALRQHLRHAARDARRSLRRSSDGGRHRRGWNESTHHFQRQDRDLSAAWAIDLQRSGSAAVRGARRAGGSRRPQARRQLPRRGIERTDDVARQGAADLVCERTRQRQSRRGGIRGGIAFHDHVLVFPRRDRRPGAAGHGDGRLLRRLDHRRHRLDAERRRPLARRSRAPAPRQLRFTLRRRQRRHWRQPDHQGRRRTIRRRPSPADHPRSIASSAMCCPWPACRLSSGSRASTICHRAAARRRSSPASRTACSASARAAPSASSVRPSPPRSERSSDAGTPDVDARRKTVNAFIRSSGIFDGVADFDAVTRDATTGGLRAEFQPNSSIGGPGDALHPNRAGYLAMGNAVDLKMLVPAARK